MTGCSGCNGCSEVLKSGKTKKISNASLGSMMSNRYALLRRGGGCASGKRVIVYSDKTVTNNSTASMLNKELSTIQREVGTCSSPIIPNMVCLDRHSEVKIIKVGGKNKYVLNGMKEYNEKIKYGLAKGTYVIKNVPQNHPMAVISEDPNISYTGETEEKTGSNAIVNYIYYSGDVTIRVTGDFGQASIHCRVHGYMGGENVLVYSNNCNCVCKGKC